MDPSEKEKSEIEQAAEDLFNFAVDREDVKWLLARIAKEAQIKPVTVEYELQILKIISVGWSIAYYLESSPHKDTLATLFWNAVFQFSRDLSATSGLMIGQDIDYFQLLKDRLDMYVDAMGKKSDTQQPAEIIGPQFAKTCGNGDDIFTLMTGTKMFAATMSRVKEFIDRIEERL